MFLYIEENISIKGARILAKDVYIIIFICALFFWCARSIVMYFTQSSLGSRKYRRDHHQWRLYTSSKPRLCNFCEIVVYGLRSKVVTCDICGMFAHSRCAKHRVAAKACPCKSSAVLVDYDMCSPQEHHWIKGNIDPVDQCAVCGLFCGSILALSGLKCAWCHRRVHEKCFNAFMEYNKTCDLGRHKKLIIPPARIIVNLSQDTTSTFRRVKSVARKAVKKIKGIRLKSRSDSIESTTSVVRRRNIRKNSSVSNDDPPCSTSEETNRIETFDDSEIKTEIIFSGVSDDEVMLYKILPVHDGTPLLVFVNSKSGGQMGLYILRKMRSWLNPLQVYDLAFSKPESVLRQFKCIPRLRILVCGGDGTVGWILGAIDRVGFKRLPPVAILPLGTGNDLARVLGWGSGYSEQRINDILDEIERAHIGVLDRWNVTIGGINKSVMNNYFGVGVDAQVALEFHKQRERSPYLFVSQFVNKLWYSRFGAKNAFIRTCAGLPQKLILECDEKLVELPDDVEGVIILNINSYGGGSTLWYQDDEYPLELIEDNRMRGIRMNETNSYLPSSPHDGLLDVVAVHGSLHLGQLQVGLSRAIRLCQCTNIKIFLKESLPIQIDGEPWMQDECAVEISYHNQSFVLYRTVEEGGKLTTKVEEILDWAESTEVINSKQRDILLREISRRVKESDSHPVRPNHSTNSPEPLCS